MPHDHWPHTIAGVGLSAAVATVAEIPWTYVFSVVGVAAAALGPPALKLWKQYQIDRIEIEARRRELEKAK